MVELIFLIFLAVLLVVFNFFGFSVFACTVTFLSVLFLPIFGSHWYHRFLLARAVRAENLRVKRFRSFRGTISFDENASLWETNSYYVATLVSEDGNFTEYFVSVNGYLFGLFGATIKYSSFD